MNERSGKSRLRAACAAGLAAALLGLVVLGCMQWRDFASPLPPEVSAEWRALIADLRAFERTIGFQETKNFLTLTGERESFAFCGRASRYLLPYSYEDPGIRWIESVTETECRAEAAEADVFYGTVEAMGEIGTPVTPSMLTSKLDRFVYLVIHEDCHDQFDLPYGVEEALCNVITYHAMDRFSSDAYRWYSRENRAIKSYTGMQSTQTRATIRHYAQLEALYARYRKAEVSGERLISERARLFASAERSLELDKGTMNNVVMANYMTYSRHYPALERAHQALGRDLRRTVEFFRHVDRIKPSKAEVMKRTGAAADSVELVRAYETAVMQTAQQALTEWKRARWSAPAANG